MIHILLIIPYDEVRQQFKSLVENINEKNISIETTHIKGTTDDLIKNNTYDIIIARGITCQAIKKQVKDVHLVEISMTAFDITNALIECKQKFSAQKVAIFLHSPPIEDITRLQELCGMQIEVYDIANEEDITHSIQLANQNGVEVFIGGLTLCHLCDDLSLKRIHIKTSKESIERAIAEAVNAAKSLNIERAKTNLIQIILNNAKDIVIAVNQKGLVTAANNQAHLNFKVSSSQTMVGQSIDSFYKGFEWQKSLQLGIETEEILRINSKLFFINCKPIKVDSQSVGVLITAQNTENVRETETKIRKELHAKGLVAKYHFGSIIGNSEKMQNIISKAYKYSQVDSSVLIVGETGTGKELFAHSVHNASKRCRQPFVAVNCAALPENLLESELFGYAEGAFSGASKGGKIGLFEMAHKGTIFLDEIGEMPIALQAKLLRVLQEREIRRIGDNRVIPIDVRLLSATNVDIKEKIKQGVFREDLYYRLNTLKIEIPPLRARKQDTMKMFHYFISKFACDSSKPIPILEEGVEEVLASYEWPGNVRELRNLCERLVILNETGMIGKAEIENLELFEVDAEWEQANSVPKEEFNNKAENEIEKMIRYNNMTKEQLAQALGISRTTLWRRLNRK